MKYTLLLHMLASPAADQLKKQIAIVVLNWNSPQDTIACLESLLPEAENQPATIIVCDNNSDGNSVELITRWALLHFQNEVEKRANDAEFVLFELDSNAGYAAGNNVGLQYAIDNAFKYVWILNNDTLVTENSLAALVDCAEKHPEIACYGSTLVDYSNPDKAQCAAGCQYNQLTTVRTEIYHALDLSWVKQQAETINPDYICGAAMFLKVEALREIGLLNQQFFLYYEELDLAQRLKKSDYQLGWCKNSVIKHRLNTNKEVSKKQQQLLHYHENLSTLIYTWLHHRTLFILPASFRLIAKIVILPLTNRIHLLSSLLKAYFDFLKHLFQNTGQNKKPVDISASLFLKK